MRRIPESLYGDPEIRLITYLWSSEESGKIRFLLLQIQLVCYAQIFVVVFQVTVGDFPQYPAGISCGNAVCRNIAKDNASGSDHGIFPDGNTRTDDNVASDPDIVFDGYFKRIHFSVGAQAVMHRMAGGGDHNIWSDQYAVSDGNLIIVHQGQVGIDINIALPTEPKISGSIAARFSRSSGRRWLKS